MTKTKAKAKRSTFRQRLLEDAEAKLNMMTEKVREACSDAVAQHSQMNPRDVVTLAYATQTKTLRRRVIADLANEAEVEVEKIWSERIRQHSGDSAAVPGD